MATVQPTIGLKNDAEATTSSNNHLIGTVEEALATPNEGNRNFWFVLTVVVVLPLFVIATSFVFGGLLAALEEWTWMEGFYYVVRRYTGHSVLCRLLRERLLLLTARCADCSESGAAVSHHTLPILQVGNLCALATPLTDVTPTNGTNHTAPLLH